VSSELAEQPRVTCVLVNWNGWKDTLECLEALQSSNYKNLSVIVVDNGSTDDSIRRLRHEWPDLVILETRKNLGFAGGNNVGIRHALLLGTEYLWLLNNDTEPSQTALSALITKALTNSKIGAVASICYYAQEPSTVQVWAGARVNLWIGYAHNSIVPRTDDWFDSLYGASLLISSAALEQIGLLDEGFFHYWEETEFCLRLRRSGWLLAAAPDSHILHKVGASTGRNNVVLDRYFTASGMRILRLHSPAPYVAMFFFLAIRFLRRLARLQFSRCLRVKEGIADYLRMLPVTPQIR
jgi:GT2 family glycosyltransferase